MKIPLWSDNDPKVKNLLLPLQTTNWQELSLEEKKRIWKYIQVYLFNPNPGSRTSHFNNVDCIYEFFGEDSWENDHLVNIISFTMYALNDKYKKKSFARNYLRDRTYNSACQDFYEIFMNHEMNVVFEMLVLFSNVTVAREGERIYKRSDETDADYEKRKDVEEWTRFDKFSSRLSSVFEEFGINYKLTRAGMLPSDEPIVIEKIYTPALKKLANTKFKEVNRDIRDAFQALTREQNGSGAITHALAALQGLLQILVHGRTGKGDTADLIKEAIRMKIIPDDDFSKRIIKEMNSFWARERQERGDPHPKKDYATKKQARLVISLIMVFIDNSL